MKDTLKVAGSFLGLCVAYVLLVAVAGLATRIFWEIFMFGWGLV